MTNRTRLARERAGLSINQAARLVGLTSDDLALIEQAPALLAEHAGLLAELYQVRVEWMTGEVSQRDYASIDKIEGADKISFHDRDVLAEFAASMPRRKP